MKLAERASDKEKWRKDRQRVGRRAGSSGGRILAAVLETMARIQKKPSYEVINDRGKV